MNSLIVNLLLLGFLLSGCKTAKMQSVNEVKSGAADAGLPDDTIIPDISEPTKEGNNGEDAGGTGDAGTSKDDSKGSTNEKLPADQTCFNSKGMILTAPLMFTERKDCSFGANDNLEKKERSLQAIESQTKTVLIPPAKEICSLTIKSSKQNLHYDDYFFLTLNNRVLISSEIRWVDFFDDQDSFKMFSFNKIRGEDYNYVEQDPKYGTPYCYLDDLCVVPDHDKEGPFQLNIKDNLSKEGSMADISKLAKETPEFTFTVYATGDNDPQDCDFSSFELNLTMEYIPMP